jgi:hypothetical protein
MKKNLLAMPVGIKQKKVVDDIVQKVSVSCLLSSFCLGMSAYYIGFYKEQGDGIWGCSSWISQCACKSGFDY